MRDSNPCGSRWRLGTRAVGPVDIVVALHDADGGDADNKKVHAAPTTPPAATRAVVPHALGSRHAGSDSSDHGTTSRRMRVELRGRGPTCLCRPTTKWGDPSDRGGGLWQKCG